MKLILALLAAAGLSGCVAYGGGYTTADVYYSNGHPSYGYGAHPSYGYGYPAYGGVIVDRGYHSPPRAYRDRDRDGIPNRYDRDRDGDGVRNRDDARPNNPRRH